MPMQMRNMLLAKWQWPKRGPVGSIGPVRYVICGHILYGNDVGEKERISHDNVEKK